MGRNKKTWITALAVLLGIGLGGAVGKTSAQTGQTLALSSQRVLDRVRACGFVTSSPVPYVGTIVGSQDASGNLSEGDYIYIQLEPGKQVKTGDRLTVARFAKEIEHPVTKKKFGQSIYFPGWVVILDGKGPIVPAIIEKSFAAVIHGDLIMASPPSMPSAVSIRMQDGLQGIILAAAEPIESISEWEVVYIDRGVSDGVIVGDFFSIYSFPYYTKEASESNNKLPLWKSGEGVVIYVTPEASTLLVTHANQGIYAGDIVVSGKGK
jgi:hypothetical protein